MNTIQKAFAGAGLAVSLGLAVPAHAGDWGHDYYPRPAVVPAPAYYPAQQVIYAHPPAYVYGTPAVVYAPAPAYRPAPRVVYAEPPVQYVPPPQYAYVPAPVYQETPVYPPATVEYYEPAPQRDPAARGMVGALAGAVIGSRFGKGDGRIAGTAVGAVVGGMLGQRW